MSALPKPRLTEEEYLAIEHEAEFRSEYIDGEMYAMAGAGEPHVIIVSNLISALHGQFRGRDRRVYSTDLRVRVADTGLYTYPDVLALCGQPEVLRADGDTLLNPQFIAEVLSPGTAFYDRVEKFRRYQQIPSFSDYLLVSQDWMFVEHRQRQPDAPDGWATCGYDQSADTVHLPTLAASLVLADIYDKVKFPAGPLQPSADPATRLRIVHAMHRPSDTLLYFDNNATTALDPAVVEAMLPFLTEWYGNPSSAYSFGSRVGRAIETARGQVAALLGCEPGEILFTGSGSEGNNTALGSALAADPDRRHVVTSSVEHSATKNYCERLARRGYEVTWLPVDTAGRLDLDEVKNAIRDDTAIVSIMWANNETGVLFPAEEIAALARAQGAYFHTDAVQAVGKVPVRLAGAPIHFLSLAGHKLHAPKGVGALYVHRRTRFTPFLVGGGQENGRRGGTENVAGIVALGKAAELAGAHLQEEATTVRGLRDRFENAVLAAVPGSEINGDPVERLPNTSSLYFPGVESEALLVLLDQAGLCASAGSACTAGSVHPSHVLTAMGFSTERARASLRFSFSRFNTAEEIDRGLTILTGAVDKLRRLIPAAVTV